MLSIEIVLKSHLKFPKVMHVLVSNGKSFIIIIAWCDLVKFNAKLLPKKKHKTGVGSCRSYNIWNEVVFEMKSYNKCVFYILSGNKGVFIRRVESK
jgi:hypothetical protein